MKKKQTYEADRKGVFATSSQAYGKHVRVARIDENVKRIPEETADQVAKKMAPRLNAMVGEIATATRGQLTQALEQRFGAIPGLASMSAAEKKEFHKMQLAHHSSGISQANLEQKKLDRERAERKQTDAERALVEKETAKGMERARKAQEATAKTKEREEAAKKKLDAKVAAAKAKGKAKSKGAPMIEH